MTGIPNDELKSDSELDGAALDDVPNSSHVATTPYNGSSWRSRFLRSPKFALELADRVDFLELGKLATIKLGLKTGNDGFFFLDLNGRATTTKVPIKGMGGVELTLPLADLMPAIQTPKELDTGAGRQAAVPTKNGRYSGKSYYLFPRDRSYLEAQVKTYVEYGETRNVNDGQLVKTNAETSATWFRQTRGQVCSRWVLPYNSGYDYGAVDNAIGAVLNGRLVGVDPIEGLDPVVLGGILNSTFTMTARLLEGVTTGNEGAFDVGPPAVRVMRVPDPHKMTPEGRTAVAQRMHEIVAAGVLPHAPLASEFVPMLRRELDKAVLVALGETPGNAAVILDKLYGSYARWRAAVEAVEDQMQEHRRALARRGGSRSESPVTRASRIVWDEMSPVSAHLFDDLVSVEYELIDAQLRRDRCTDQTALFDSAVVIDRTGAPLDLGDERRLRLVELIRGTGLNGEIPIALDPVTAERLSAAMSAADGKFLAEAMTRAASHVNDELVVQVAEAARRAWLAASGTSLRGHIAAADPETAPDPSLFEPEGLVPPLSGGA